MKKNAILTILTLSFLGSFMFSGTVSPSMTLRFNDIVETTANSGTVAPVVVVGITMDVAEGVYAGLDSDGTDSRIFVGFEYGTMGMGMDANGDPQFTVGAKYGALSNLDVSLDYVINNLTTSGAGGTAVPNELRLSLGVTF
tara:strand:- start:3 stop:425 length:423 start_codon:yes stop_codon:yes gene_type:complete